MPTNFQKTRQFHQKFDAAPLPLEQLLPQREAFLLEEVAEVREAMAEVLAATPENRREAMAHLAKELADLLAITYGTFVQLGVDADAAYDEVWRSNMSKTPRPGGGKALKGEGYQPAQMEKVIP